MRGICRKYLIDNDRHLNNWFDPLDIDESIDLGEICDNYFIMFKEYYAEQITEGKPLG